MSNYRRGREFQGLLGDLAPTAYAPDLSIERDVVGMTLHSAGISFSQGLTVLPQSFRQVGCRIRDVRVGCLFCGLGLLMSLSVQQYTIGNSRRVLNG